MKDGKERNERWMAWLRTVMSDTLTVLLFGVRYEAQF